jgi:hypothetical protein
MFSFSGSKTASLLPSSAELSPGSRLMAAKLLELCGPMYDRRRNKDTGLPVVRYEDQQASNYLSA